MAAHRQTRKRPVALVVGRYMQRRRLSVSELSQRTGRTPRAIQYVLSGQSLGLKPWGGEATLMLLAEELEIPERELRRAIADEVQYAWDRNATAGQLSSPAQTPIGPIPLKVAS